MADQDFNIKVVTTADTSGLTKTADEMARIRQQGLLSPIPAELSGATAVAAKETEKMAAASLLTGVNLGKARQEAIVLARELATGGNVMRTLGSLMGAFGTSITVAAIGGLLLFERIKSWGESIKNAAEDQVKLNREIDQSVKGYANISTAAQWDKENDKIEEQIQLLRDKRRFSTDPTEQQNLSKEIEARQRQQQDLAILAQRGYERAQAEEKVKLSIRDQIDAMAQADKTAPVGVEAAKAKREEAEKNFDAVQATEAAQLEARADSARLAQQSADAELEVASAKKKLAEDEKEARLDPGSVDVSKARERLNQAEREAQVMRELASGAANYVLELDKGKDALSAQLLTTKAILEYRRRAEQQAKAAAQTELQKLVPGLSGQQPTKEVDQSVQRVLMNEQAAAKAHAEGREKDEEMFTKSAEAYKRGLNPDQQKQLQKVLDKGQESGDPTLAEILAYMKSVWGQ